MALRNYITHPADGSLEVLHVQNGAAKTTIENTLPIAVDPGVVTVTQSGAILVDTATPLDVTVTNPSILPTGQPFAVRNSDLITVNNTTLPLLSVQHGGVGALKMALRQWEVYNDGRDIAFLDLVLGGTLTGAVFAPVDASSEFEVDFAATAITGGRVIASMLVGRDTSRNIIEDITSALLLNAGTPGPLTVVATDQAGARSVQVASTLSWLEN